MASPLIDCRAAGPKFGLANGELIIMTAIAASNAAALRGRRSHHVQMTSKRHPVRMQALRQLLEA
jgi:hypothetical protein